MPWATTSSRDAKEASCAANCLSWSERDLGEGERHGKRLRAVTRCAERPGEQGTGARASQETHRLGVRIQGCRKGRESPDLSNAPFPHFQGDAGVQPLMHELNRDEVAFARDLLRERAKRLTCPGLR